MQQDALENMHARYEGVIRGMQAQNEAMMSLAFAKYKRLYDRLANKVDARLAAIDTRVDAHLDSAEVDIATRLTRDMATKHWSQEVWVEGRMRRVEEQLDIMTDNGLVDAQLGHFDAAANDGDL